MRVEPVWRIWIASLCLVLAGSGGVGCATAAVRPGSPTAGDRLPGRSVNETLRRAIGLLEHYECDVVAVDFLSPIKRRQIQDLDAYRQRRQCAADDRGNLDDVLLALTLGLAAKPEMRGVRAVIDLSGVGLPITSLEFIRYTDGRWYFNEL